MAQTYLQLINKVLVALREDAVLSVSEPYSKLIGQFVNDAKTLVEDSHPWRALRTEVTFSATSGNTSATLSTTNDRSYLMYDTQARPMLFRTDSGYESRVRVCGIEDLRAMRLTSTSTDTAEPCYVAFTSDGTNLVAHWWPSPDATYNYKGVFVVPQAELSDKDDTLTIPFAPVVAQAIAYAMDERGSEFAGRLETIIGRATAVLNEARLADMAGEDYTVVAE